MHMDYLLNNPKLILTLSDFVKMDVVEDDELNGRARVVMAYRFGQPVCLAGFSADPSLKDFDIQEQAFHYYQKLRRILKQNAKPSIWKN